MAMPNGRLSSSGTAQSIFSPDVGERPLEAYLQHLDGVEQNKATRAASLRPSELARTQTRRTCRVSKHTDLYLLSFPSSGHTTGRPKAVPDCFSRVSIQSAPALDTPEVHTKRGNDHVRGPGSRLAQRGRGLLVRVSLSFEHLPDISNSPPAASCLPPTKICSGQCCMTSSNCRLALPAEVLCHRLFKIAQAEQTPLCPMRACDDLDTLQTFECALLYVLIIAEREYPPIAVFRALSGLLPHLALSGCKPLGMEHGQKGNE